MPSPMPQNIYDKYKGKFDDGYEAYREWVYGMIARNLAQRYSTQPFNPLPEAIFESCRLRATLEFT